MIVFFQVMLRRALGVGERCENDEGPDLMPDVTWHLAGEPAGGQAVRTTDCQPSSSQAMQLGGGGDAGRLGPRSQLLFSGTRHEVGLEGKGSAHTGQVCA